MINAGEANGLISWNYGSPNIPYFTRDAFGGYNHITDEFFIFGGFDSNGNHDVGYKYSYANQT